MDKYHMVVMVFLLGGMGIAITRDPPVLPMFYAMVAGIVIIILYGAVQRRRAVREERRRKRGKK